MTGRLSEQAVIQSLDTGWQTLVWNSNKSSENSLLSSTVNFHAILDAKDPVAAAQSIPRRDMYLALVTKGPEDALEVLPLLSEEQFVAIIDNEAWVEDRLSIHQAIRWLDLYKHLGPEQFYQRFRELDEEYQVALLSPYIEMVDEDAYEKLAQEVQDKFRPMPCNTLWWRVKNDDEKIHEFVASIIDASIGEDAAYLYSLLGMSAMMPPNEQEAMIKQFRDARQEEDGFVKFEESLALFTNYSTQAGKDLLRKWQGPSSDEAATFLKPNHSAQLFLDEVLALASRVGNVDAPTLENIRKGFAFLGNAVSSACRVAPDDIHGLTSVLQQVRHTVSFGLQVLAAGNPHKAVEILFTEYPKTLFQFSLSTIDMIRMEAIANLKILNLSAATKLEQNWRTGKFGACMRIIDVEILDYVGFENAETLKGLFNRFPMVKDEITTTDKIKRVKFRLLASTFDYNELLTEIKNITNTPKGTTLQ